MVDILLLQTVSLMIASAGVFVAAVYYVLQIRHQNKAKQMELVMKLYSEFGSRDFIKLYPEFFFNTRFSDYEEFQDKYPWDTFRTSEAGVSYEMTGWFFEGVGLLLHRKLIDIELVDDLFTIAVKQAWEKVRPIAEGLRKERNAPQYWEWFEYLYNELKKREQKLQQSKV